MRKMKNPKKIDFNYYFLDKSIRSRQIYLKMRKIKAVQYPFAIIITGQRTWDQLIDLRGIDAGPRDSGFCAQTHREPKLSLCRLSKIIQFSNIEMKLVHIIIEQTITYLVVGWGVGWELIFIYFSFTFSGFLFVIVIGYPVADPSTRQPCCLQ